MSKIVQNISELKKPLTSLPKNKDEQDVIAAALFTALKREKGYGLSANQIGIDKRVCVINTQDPLVLVNPRITNRSEEAVVYIESCLSLPKSMRKPVKTVRSTSITVETDNLGTIEFGPSEPDKIGTEGHNYFGDEGLLECVVAQHEIDHLDGILITDSVRRYTQTIKTSKKYGRNERVMVKLSDGSTEFMKYKKAEPLLSQGAEIL
jgi:peptide deformylase|tara:strand:+ start:2659 stop:3279 length:621 start_codon:yes stop_codon:yes gene_type:complete